MKLLSKFALINLCCFSALVATAQDLAQYNQLQANSNAKDLIKYFLNMGGYFGYDFTQSPTANNAPVSQTLLDMTDMQTAQMYSFNTLLGATPVNALSAALAQFIPNTMANASAINAWANYTFSSQNYNSPGSQGQGTVTVSPLIDQPPYLQDPVNQAVQNILQTPDYTYCMDNDATNWIPSCTLLFQNRVSSQVVGTLPNTTEFLTPQYNQQFINQLNSNTLLAPLLYATESNSNNNNNNNDEGAGLTAQNQVQAAANFIRYASGAVTPITLPKHKDYDTLYTQANGDLGGTLTLAQKMQARATLSTYFTNLRTYAAQSSVGLSNLYFILSKRLPQNQGGTTSSIPSSQALNEFNMATKRLFNPDLSVNKQWITQINSASPTTIQKEMAILLAEINYQMYLDRQMQERLLLTQTILLMQNTKASQPNSNFSISTANSPQSQ